MLKYLLYDNIVIYIIKRRTLKVLSLFNENEVRLKKRVSPLA